LRNALQLIEQPILGPHDRHARAELWTGVQF
jgi:hypothetical protein